MNRIRHCYARIVKTSGLVDRTEAGRHVAWFERWCQRLGAIAEYNLLHGDLHGQNVIIAPDGKVHALDFIATHFGYFERDLAVCARTLVARSSFRHELFFAEYFRIAGPDAARRYQAHQPFFTAQVCLEMVYSSTVKAWRIDRGLKHQTGPYASEAKKFLEILRQTIEASPDPAAGA
jgi:aminoglycoside phosphotransferase (APT) family kinase protein